MSIPFLQALRFCGLWFWWVWGCLESSVIKEVEVSTTAQSSAMWKLVPFTLYLMQKTQKCRSKMTRAVRNERKHLLFKFSSYQLTSIMLAGCFLLFKLVQDLIWSSQYPCVASGVRISYRWGNRRLGPSAPSSGPQLHPLFLFQHPLSLTFFLVSLVWV